VLRRKKSAHDPNHGIPEGDQGGRRGHARTSFAKFWIAWYVSLVLLWLLFVDTFARSEVVLGLVAAAVAATAADLVRAQDLVRFRLELPWLGGLHRLPWQILGDCRLLAVALWRQLTGRAVHGAFRALPFPRERDDARSAARRALVTGTVSLTPNTYVVGIEGDEGVMLVHQLVPEAANPVPDSMLEDPS
jgi:multisubunit Na+/H+ antiporter MnhE subunit